MRNKIITILVLSACFLGGCLPLFLPPKLLSFRYPAFSTASYSRIIIFADIPDWQHGYRIEQRFVELLQDNGIQALSAIKFMPPYTYLD
ncbi:MAG: hypothetical protein HYZ54_07920 [Ignavibacteriae bacterium]|nr:hypothetical protein [Ignavibacteriota bacterium]